MSSTEKQIHFLEQFSSCAEIIKDKIGDSKVYYIHNVGNWGDGIIRFSSLRFLQHYSIYYEEIINYDDIWKHQDCFNNAVLLYQGSGAFCKLWNHSRLILRLDSIFKSIIVLPSSYEFGLPLPNIVCFCRDTFESKQNMPAAIFCHDLAFFTADIDVPDGVGIGNFFRTDKESKNVFRIPPDNCDLSLLGTHFSPVQPFFNSIAKFSEIHTDRLHIAICGSLLNREVHFYPGSYFKNKAVYQSSMKGVFPNTVFHDAPEVIEC